MRKTTVIKIEGKFNNANAPILPKYDAIENKAGSLFLWDGGLQSTDLVPDSVFPNLLNDPEFTLAQGKEFNLHKGTNANINDVVRLEKTSKGALHFIVSQLAASIDRQSYYAVKANAALNAYLYALSQASSKKLYVSMWTRITRNSVAEITGGLAIYSTGNTANMMFQLTSRQSAIYCTGNSTSKLNKPASDVSVKDQPNWFHAEITGNVGTGVSNSSVLTVGGGNYDPWFSVSDPKGCPSWILERIYIEDLEASGRTMAEVDAIDIAEFNRAHAAGGRFYGDTWSNPSVLLP